MFHVDNKTTTKVKPDKRPLHDVARQWFTDQTGKEPTVPQADWFNTVQAELLAIIDEVGVDPDKLDDAQIVEAIKKLATKSVDSRIPEGKDQHFLLGNKKKSYDLKTIEDVKKILGITAGQLPTEFENDLYIKTKDGKYELIDNEQMRTDLNILDRIGNTNDPLMHVGAFGVGRAIAGRLTEEFIPTSFVDNGIRAYRTSEVVDGFPQITPTLHWGADDVYGKIRVDYRVARIQVTGGALGAKTHWTAELWNNKNTHEDKHGFLTTKSGVNALVDEDLPVGIPMPWSLEVAPKGWFVMMGQKFDKNKYPKLAIAYPDGIIPAPGGYGIRAWDSTGEIDPGRELLSYQEDATQRVTGFAAYNGNLGSGGAIFSDAGRGYTMTTATVNTRMGFDNSRVVRTADEERVKNIAYNYIVRAA